MLHEWSEDNASELPFSLAIGHKADGQVLESVRRTTGLASGDAGSAGCGEMVGDTVPSYDDDNPKGPSVPSYDK